MEKQYIVPVIGQTYFISALLMRATPRSLYPATSARSGEHSWRHLPTHHRKKRQFDQQGQGICWI